MRQSLLLIIDAAINLGLGLLLVLFPSTIVEWLGVPYPDQPFYANILGAVFIGIAIALAIEIRRDERYLVGLGLGGAVAINLCGGLALTLWLLFGDLSLTNAGLTLLWLLVVLLVGLSSFEFVSYLHNTNDHAG